MKSRTGIAIANIGEPAPESSLKSAGVRRTPSEKQRLTARQPCGVTLAIRRNSPERKPASRTESTNWGSVLGLRSFR
jgi:hypothetical protein